VTSNSEVSYREKGVVDTSASAYARLRPVPPSAVSLGRGFWRPRFETNYKTSIPRLHRLLEEHGVLDNFRRLYGAADVPRRGLLFTDSDIYKWMEAASWVLHSQEAPEVASLLDSAIDAVLPAQQPDGYLNTYYVDERADQRFTRLDTDHELYCAGHLFQAAVAHHRATGDTRLLDCATRFADYLCQVFGPDAKRGWPGHPEIEMALVELYRETNAARYLDLARFFMEENSFTRRHHFEGHAVRATYWACGGADVYAETGEQAFLATLESQWQEMISCKMYITGGLGGRWRGESVGRPFELPNEGAYAETCAAIGNVFWNWRMAAISGEARFTDILERALYNGFLSGVSLDGTAYFYVNPLAATGEPEGDPWYEWGRRGLPQRQEWYECTCCPPNVQRMIASLPSYFYSTSNEGLWVHLYDKNALDWHLADGSPIRLHVDTDYPWDGQIRLTIDVAPPRETTLFLRVPEWAEGATLRVNGETQPAPSAGSYASLKRRWRPGDSVHLELPMPSVLMGSDPRVPEDRAAVAIQRGPLVYCLESIDNPDFDVYDASLLYDPGETVGTLKAERCPGLLGGIVTLRGKGLVPERPADQGPLYRPLSREREITSRQVDLVAIPYYAWANRGPARMTVWLRRSHVG